MFAKAIMQGQEMNKTEAAFASRLRLMQLAGEIHSFKFTDVTLKIGDDCRYTPDFMVLENDGTMTFYEVKGFWRDDARVKIKVAARTFPMFRFVAVQYQKKQWIREEIKP